MQTFGIRITGTQPLLMHYDNIDWADFMNAWQAKPENKKTSKAGDDRTPAWRWLGCCYHDGQFIGLPQANLMRSIMEGGAMVPVPGGRSGKTFKAQTQSGMMTVEPFWPLTLADGRKVPWADVMALKDENDFTANRKAAESLGFSLHVKRARVGQNKHIRVRPQFDSGWSISGTIAVWDEQITKDALYSIMEYAGKYKGLGDWRPGGKTPGPYGMFQAEFI